METHDDASVPQKPQIVADGKPVAPVLAPWNYKSLLIAFVISIVLQMLFLPCMCKEGEIKVNFAMLFDSFVLVRIFIAVLRKECGRGWLFYAALLITSPVWITLLVSCFSYLK